MYSVYSNSNHEVISSPDGGETWVHVCTCHSLAQARRICDSLNEIAGVSHEQCTAHINELSTTLSEATEMLVQVGDVFKQLIMGKTAPARDLSIVFLENLETFIKKTKTAHNRI